MPAPGTTVSCGYANRREELMSVVVGQEGETGVSLAATRQWHRRNLHGRGKKTAKTSTVLHKWQNTKSYL